MKGAEKKGKVVRLKTAHVDLYVDWRAWRSSQLFIRLHVMIPVYFPARRRVVAKFAA